MPLHSFEMQPIGIIHSPYKEKFAIPRQPRLASQVISHIQLQGEINTPEAVRGLSDFSHIWLLFLFDQNLNAGWKPTVRPPRLGGNQRLGVLATRSTFRPNAIGMSAVELVDVCTKNKDIWITVRGADLMHGTPILDIKPYIPYSDSLPDSTGGFAENPPESLPVIFNDKSQLILAKASDGNYKRQVIQDVLAQDPRPAYKKGKPDSKTYAVHLFDFNVCFQFEQDFIQVTDLAAFK